jgi:hypothetical protein
LELIKLSDLSDRHRDKDRSAILSWHLKDDGCTVTAMDLVVPGIGEIVGGGSRRR